MANHYPEETIQSVAADGEWWEKSTDLALCRGRLIWAFVPLIESNPKTLQGVSRGADPGDHSTATFRLAPLRAADARNRASTAFPVAALPLASGEVHGVFRTKRRPMIVLSEISPSVPRSQQLGGRGWQTSAAVLAAPAYGIAKTPTRTGWPAGLIPFVQKAEYPQYMWDIFPNLGEPTGSIVRFDQVCPIGTGSQAYEPTENVLSPVAMTIVEDWFQWFLTGLIPERSALKAARDLLTE